MQERLGVTEKEWDKYRGVFVIQGKPHYVEEDERSVNTKEFRGISLHGQSQQSGRPWIGLEHTNKANKRSRYNYMEKAIKIYNWLDLKHHLALSTVHFNLLVPWIVDCIFRSEHELINLWCILTFHGTQFPETSYWLIYMQVYLFGDRPSGNCSSNSFELVCLRQSIGFQWQETLCD